MTSPTRFPNRRFPSAGPVPLRLSTIATLMLGTPAALLLSALPGAAQEFYDCPGPQTDSVSCTVPADDDSAGVNIYETMPSDGASYTLTNNADFTEEVAPQQNLLSITLLGDDPSGDAVRGVDGATIEITNNGNLTLTGSSTGATTSGERMTGIFAKATGGNGSAATSNDDGGRGGDGGYVTVNNYGNITLDGAVAQGSTADVEAMGIYVNGDAGNGGTQGSGVTDEKGGNGGDAKNLTVTNTGTITIGSSDAPFAGYTAGHGIGVEGTGGTGGADNGNGGSGSQISITHSGTISVDWQSQDGMSDGVRGISGESHGSDGLSSSDNSDPGGKGEAGKQVQVQSSGNIAVTNTPAANVAVPTGASGGIYALSLGGDGGTSPDKNTGGAGGEASMDASGDAGVTSIQHSVGAIDVSGGHLMGMVAASRGGDGGNGNGDSDSAGGAGGYGGQIQIDLTASGTVSTAGGQGYAVVGQSVGGIGGGNAGTAGAGGDGGAVGFYSDTSTEITTTGDYSNGVTLQSIGGGGGVGADFTNVLAGDGGDGGNGGDAQQAEITSGTTVTTSGQYSHGLLVQSLGGSGGSGGIGTGVLIGLGGNGGEGGQGAHALVNNTGAVTTHGYGSNAIMAQSLAGGGGAAGMSGGGLSVGGTAGNSGNTFDGVAEITSNGDVTTTADASIAMVAHAIGGGGGSAAGSAGIASVGGSGGAGGVGGTARVYVVGGTVATGGDFSHGVVAQSIGGGGGTGGDVIDVSVGVGLGVGGSGSAGGAGGEACIANFYTDGCSSGPLDSGSAAPAGGTPAVVGTSGDFSIAMLSQSIGGGGGNGGSATGASAVTLATLQVGGSGATGGNGGTATVNLDTIQVTTAGDNAPGIVTQSIGGGGGNGGNATAYSGENLLPVQIGGSASHGANGGSATATLKSVTVATAGSNAPAVTVQSIGGGGGNGGATSGKDASLGFTFQVGVGGSGGAGGTGGTATATLSEGSIIQTGMNADGTPDHDAADAFGILVQSVGGGGGNGGASAADSLTVAVPDFEGESFAVSADISVGGAGGVAGNGGTATVSLDDTSQVTTGGDGSHGVVVQSISHGGGTAGSASTMSVIAGDADSVEASGAVAIGNDGGAGGTADAVTLTMGAGASVTTHGDHANGLVAQSIAGGGGAGSVGSATNSQVGGGFQGTMTIGLGGTGGSGGQSGTVTLMLDAGSAITTYGSGARGIVAQSIAGGGGTSQGSTIGIGASESEGEDPASATVGLSIGASGGAGAPSATVDVTHAGEIRTFGGDADGILAQSISGSGGLGGSVGNDAGGDDDGGLFGGDAGTSYTLTASLGGTGGTAGQAWTVKVAHSGLIYTEGDWSDGIVAQSIGGGGGAGGTSTAAGSEATAQIAVGVGGSGGVGGNGGEVDVTLDDSTGPAAIVTRGYAAHGLLMQSVGGGGGQGADGSDSSSGQITVGGALGGSGGVAGDGHPVSLVEGSGGTITTAGADAYGILAQSIGGGGGIAGAGNSGAADGDSSDDDPSLHLEVTIGGGAGAGGEGGTVDINYDGDIVTTGRRAIALVAQSIGGGGGIGGASSSSSLASLTLGGSGGAAGNANVVTIDYSGVIATEGDGAYGIVAQSIGGGGGLGGDASGGVTGLRGLDGGSTDNGGTGAAVNVTFDGTLVTEGDRAHGIVAQSLGGGGGISGGIDGVSFGTAGGMSSESDSGTVTVVQDGTLTTSGTGSIGILAQSMATYTSNTVDVTINGDVTGGTGADGVGVAITEGMDNVLTINAGGSLSAGDDDAYAVVFDGVYDIEYGMSLAVDNHGTLRGNVSLTGPDSDAAGTLTNETGGVFYAGAVLNANVVNDGTLYPYSGTSDDLAEAVLVARPAGASWQGTRVSGDFTQSAGGRMVVGADFAGGSAGHLRVEGDARIDGGLSISASSLVQGRELSVISVGGSRSGSLAMIDGNAVAYAMREVGGETFVTVSDTRFGRALPTLSGNQRQTGRYLDRLFDAGSGSYADFLGAMSQLADGADGGASYGAALSSMSLGGAQAAAAAESTVAQSRLGMAIGCPSFSRGQISPDQQSCFWGEVGGGNIHQSGEPGYDGTRYGVSAGGQIALGGDWFAGLAAGYEHANYDATDNRTGSDGYAGFVSASLSRQFGAFTVSGALNGSYGRYDAKRSIALPDFSGMAKGSYDLYTLGARARVAYQAELNRFAYIKPLFDLDVIYSSASSYDEGGAGSYNLSVASESNTAVVATPALELGGRIPLSEDWDARLYAMGGISFSSLDSWETSSRLTGAPAGSGSFDSALPVPDMLGRVNLGLQLTSVGGVDLRAEYGGDFGDSYESHSGTFWMVVRF